MEILGLAVPGGGLVASGGKVEAVIMGLMFWAEQEDVLVQLTFGEGKGVSLSSYIKRQHSFSTKTI